MQTQKQNLIPREQSFELHYPLNLFTTCNQIVMNLLVCNLHFDAVRVWQLEDFCPFERSKISTERTFLDKLKSINSFLTA